VTDVQLPPWCTLVRADNPGPMTLDGTNTYVLRAAGANSGIVVDPGPLDAKHLSSVAGHGPVELILLTHGHPDHSEGAFVLREMTGAPIAAVDPAFVVNAPRLTGSALFDDVAGLTVRVLLTPGHTSDSVCFLVEHDDPAVLTGDTVLGRGSTVVAHPDGQLGPYLDSLSRLQQLGPITLLPGHGPVRGDAGSMARDYLVHRTERLEQVRAALAAGVRRPEDIVSRVYADVEQALWPAAERSVRAQLEYLGEPT
jgi:glyoxylase-like metal-dependent hydrolase (beta-lactamase superfamily II)